MGKSLGTFVPYAVGKWTFCAPLQSIGFHPCNGGSFLLVENIFGADYLLNQVVLADWSASDALSGLALAGAPVASGQAIDTSSAGEKLFQVKAEDKAGNQVAVAHSYIVLSPEEAIRQLQNAITELVETDVLKRGQANGLLRPLENAVLSLNKDHTADACNQIDDFIEEVEAKTPVPIDPVNATALMSAAEDIATVSLVCP